MRRARFSSRSINPAWRAPIEALAAQEGRGRGSGLPAQLHQSGSRKRRLGEAIARRLHGVAGDAIQRRLAGDARVTSASPPPAPTPYLQPLIGRYLGEARGASWGGARAFTVPLLLMTSGGGITTSETAIRFPVRLVESGPGRRRDLRRLHSRAQHGLDQGGLFVSIWGGTTRRKNLPDRPKRSPQTARAFEGGAGFYRFLKRQAGLPLRIPVIEMVEIGAGGGSIARVDTLGRIAVGPDSAGLRAGTGVLRPRRQKNPTVTDADLILGAHRSRHVLGRQNAA